MDLQQLLNAGELQPDSLNDVIINTVPVTPTRIRSMGIFEAQPMLTNLMKITLDEQTQQLVPSVPRGSPSQPKTLGNQKVKYFEATHLPQRSTVIADELLTIRARSGNNFQQFVGGVAGKIRALQTVHKRDIDYTIEYHMLGALRGNVLNADGSTLLDIYTEFGVTQQVLAMALGTPTTKVRTKVLQLKRMIESALLGTGYQHAHVLCGPGFMDKFISHGDVEKAYDRYMDGAALRDDPRRGFTFGQTGVTFEEVNGSIGGQPAIPEDEALAFPVGVPGMYLQGFAPADTMDAIGAESPIDGLPYYSIVYPLDEGKGLKLLSQSNPLTLNTRPRAIIRLTTN